MKIQTLLFISSLLLTPMITQAKGIATSNQASTSHQSIHIPQRGNNMKKVQHQHGKAKRITRSKGKITKKWPLITRWEYARFTVYFENKQVIHTVMR